MPAYLLDTNVLLRPPIQARKAMMRRGEPFLNSWHGTSPVF